jgi:hypothetical protein
MSLGLLLICHFGRKLPLHPSSLPASSPDEIFCQKVQQSFSATILAQSAGDHSGIGRYSCKRMRAWKMGEHCDENVLAESLAINENVKRM